MRIITCRSNQSYGSFLLFLTTCFSKKIIVEILMLLSTIENNCMKTLGVSVSLTLSCIMPQNGQTYFKNLAASALYVWPFWDIMH